MTEVVIYAFLAGLVVKEKLFIYSVPSQYCLSFVACGRTCGTKYSINFDFLSAVQVVETSAMRTSSMSGKDEEDDVSCKDEEEGDATTS